MTIYSHTDKKTGDGLAITDWNNMSSALAGASALTLATRNPADNVGIGTSSPDAKYKLDVNGALRCKDLALGDQGGGGAKLRLTDVDTTHFIRAKDWWTEFVSHPNEGWKFISSDGTTPTERVRISSAGKVGIGTSAPAAPLSISGDGKKDSPDGSMHITNDCILFGGNNSGKEVNSAQISAGKHETNTLCIMGMGVTAAERKVTICAEGGLKVNGSVTASGSITATKLFGDGSALTNMPNQFASGGNLAVTAGNVGIGTSTPDAKYKLDVNGTLRCTDLALGAQPGGSGKLLLTSDPNTHYIRAKDWWTEFVSHPSEGWKFISNNGTITNERVRISGDGKVGIGTSAPAAPLSISGGGKKDTPDGTMHITNDCIMFGGDNNSGKEKNSAQISAGKNESNSLNIIGMGTTATDRKVTIWAEGGLKVNGSIYEQLEFIDALGREDWYNADHPVPLWFIARLKDKPIGMTLRAFGKLTESNMDYWQNGYFMGYKGRDRKVVVTWVQSMDKTLYRFPIT